MTSENLTGSHNRSAMVKLSKMRIFFTLLLLIPCLSWAGNIERHYCESWTYTDKSTGKSKEISSNKKNPYIFFMS